MAGRGWRDLWQDSPVLLLSQPAGVRGDLLAYFAGVRTDGTNATIIGSRPGEFKTDRNNIPRVWMDHGFWPLLATALYLDETGDADFLLEKQSYFADNLPWRGEWKRETQPGSIRSGTVLEHILVQMVMAFFDVGEHGHIRLRGTDWNDGLDMAVQRRESAAFTAAYAYGLELLAGAIRRLAEKGHESLALSAPLAVLLDFPSEDWGVPEKMRRGLLDYCASADRTWENTSCSAAGLAGRLLATAGWIRDHIARTEWVGDGAALHRFNSYYDNSGRQVEGLRRETVRMMLTGQAFGVRGYGGDLVLSPKLTAGQFGILEISCTAAGRRVRVRYENPQKLDWGEYRIGVASAGDRQWTARNGVIMIRKEEFPEIDGAYLELFTSVCGMHTGMSKVEITCREGGLEASALYFGVPGERAAALARVLTVRNMEKTPATLELLDGMPALAPYGVNQDALKNMANLAKAWMQAEDVATGRTDDPVFDAYCRQTYLDNLLRGGAPVFFESEGKKSPFYIYSRKHGNPERKYNYFSLGGEYYAQGNGNFRDINQNRRCSVLFAPETGAEDIHTFFDLI